MDAVASMRALHDEVNEYVASATAGAASNKDVHRVSRWKSQADYIARMLDVSENTLQRGKETGQAMLRPSARGTAAARVAMEPAPSKSWSSALGGLARHSAAGTHAQEASAAKFDEAQFFQNAAVEISEKLAASEASNCTLRKELLDTQELLRSSEQVRRSLVEIQQAGFGPC